MPHFNRRMLLTGSTATAASLALGGRVYAQSAVLPPAPKPEQWARSPDLSHVSLSPDGNHIAYIREQTGNKYLVTYDIVKKETQTFNLGPAKVNGAFWIDSIHMGISTLATDKIDAFAGGRMTFSILSVYNLQAKSINVLFSNIEGYKSFITGGVNVITKNGKRLITAATYPVNFDESKSLYIFDLDNGLQSTLIDRAPWGTRNWVLTPQGEMLARSVYSNKTNIWTLQYYTKGTWKDIFTTTSVLEYPSLIGLGRDGKSVVVSRKTADTGWHYYEVSPEGVFSEPLPNHGKGSGPLFDTTNFRLCGYSSYDGWSHYDYFDPVMNDVLSKAQKAMDGYRMRLIDYAEDPQKVIVYSEGSDDAGTYYFINFITGQTITIGPRYPEIPPEWMSEKQSIKYKAADGLEIEAYLTLPPNKPAKNLALIVLPHGGPEARDGIECDWEVQALAARGYAVLQPNYRGSEGYGEDFTKAGHSQIGRKMQTDLSDGVRELVKQGLVNLKRVAIYGASYGGYAALAGPTLDPGVYNCAVDVAGLTDLPAFLEWSRDYDAGQKSGAYNYWKNYFGDEAGYKAASPINNVAKVTVPILIIHGKDDTVVPMSQSTTMVAALKNAGKDVTFVQYDHSDHWETNESARIDMIKTVVDFLEKHNPPG